MSSFLALYRGNTLSNARIVAVTADPGMVSDFAGRLLGAPDEPVTDPVLDRLESGKRGALRIIHSEAGNTGAE